MDCWVQTLADEYSAQSEIPHRFLAWAAIGALSAVARRKIWLRVGSDILLPNVYVMLVGEPASGKSTSLDIVKRIIEDMPTFVDTLGQEKPEINLSPDAITWQKMLTG